MSTPQHERSTNQQIYRRGQVRGGPEPDKQAIEPQRETAALPDKHTQGAPLLHIDTVGTPGRGSQCIQPDQHAVGVRFELSAIPRRAVHTPEEHNSERRQVRISNETGGSQQFVRAARRGQSVQPQVRRPGCQVEHQTARDLPGARRTGFINEQTVRLRHLTAAAQNSRNNRQIERFVE